MFRRHILLAGAALVACASVALAQPMAVDLGSITSDQMQTTTIAPNEVFWYTFSIPGGAVLGDGTYFDVTTSGPDTTIDTEIGLYDAAGNRVANDDDNGIGLTSTLTFGSGSGLMLGDSFNLGGNGLAEGENGNLAAGTYYLALGEFNVDFGDTGWNVVSTGTDTGGAIKVSFFTNVVPEPSAIALIGIGLAALGASRRRG